MSMTFDISKASELDTVHTTQQPNPKGRSTPSPDSGYAPTTTTPDQGVVKLPTGKFFKRKVRLKVFEEEIPTHVKDRFLDLQELFDRPLYERLVSSGKNFGPISSKLKRLGESKQTSAYWLVIQCEPKMARRVRQFFDQDHVKSEYQPRNESGDLPWFNIWICPEPLILAGVQDASDEEEQDLSDVESEDGLSGVDFELDYHPSDDSRMGQGLGISKTDFLQPRPIVFVERTKHKTKRCFDWVLAALNEADLYCPNCRMRANSDDEDGVTATTVESDKLRETDRRSTRLAVSRRVVIVDERTDEVYGHVVASDIFGEVYVAPLKETLKQVEEVLGADSVSLPTKFEVAAWIDLRNAQVQIHSRRQELEFLPSSFCGTPKFTFDSAYVSYNGSPDFDDRGL
ncbi:MAG: hypothetical protein Q9214_003423 [Letrouitia sp. 1 TL-2023]